MYKVELRTCVKRRERADRKKGEGKRAKPGGRPADIPRREIVNAIFYVLRSACPWRYLPHEFPRWFTVYSYFRRWKRDGTWERVHHALRRDVRVAAGREPEPSAAIIDSQSIKTSPVRGDARGYDGAKKNLGQKTACAGGHIGALDVRKSACSGYQRS